MLKHVKSNKIDQTSPRNEEIQVQTGSFWELISSDPYKGCVARSKPEADILGKQDPRRPQCFDDAKTMKRPQDFDVCWSGWWFGTCWNMIFFMTFHIYWECHHPNWRTPSFFRGVGQPPTRYLYYISHILTIILTNSCLFLDFNVQQLHHQDDESKIWWIPVWIPRKRKPGGRLLRIFGNLLPGVLMCIDVYCCILFVW